MAPTQLVGRRGHLLLPLLSIALFAAAVNASAQAAASDPALMQVLNQKKNMRSARSLLQAPKLDCPATCLGRCSNNWKNEMCNDKCNVCCKHCNCVPPGTGQDTRHLCPCYDTMINPHNGKLKCP